MRAHTKKLRNERHVYNNTNKQTINISPHSLFNDRHTANRVNEREPSPHTLPSVVSTSSLSSLTSSYSNYSTPSITSPPIINSNQLKKNQSLNELHHRYSTQSKYNNTGTFINTKTFSAPISPNQTMSKLPPIHKRLKQRPKINSSNNCNINSNISNSLLQHTMLINNHPNKMNSYSFHKKVSQNRKFRYHAKKHRKNIKRNQSSPALHLDLSTLSIDENSNKLHTYHNIHKNKNKKKIKINNNHKIPQSAHCTNLSLNAEGIKSNILLQFDLAPKHIDNRSLYEITETGAFKQNGFIISSNGMCTERNDTKYSVESTDFVEVSILGRGSSSVVYKTWDLPNKRFIALKCISVFEQDKRKQIMNELKLLTNNNCSHILNFYGAYFYSGQIIFCLEYFDIGSLQNLIEINGCIPLNIISYILKYIIKALNYLHTKRKIIYRDIKPSNILIHSNGCVKLSDFGIYHEFDDNELFINEMIGTTIYKCPQRLCGKPYSYLSDIWSIGLCVAQSLYPQFPLFINYDESIMLITKYILNTNKPIHQFFPKHIFTDEINSELVIDFMDKCLLKDESLRLTAQQLLKHKFILKYNEITNNFKSYLLSSNINKEKKDKSKIELVSIKQSLLELFTKNKITKNDMQIPIQQIQKKIMD